MGNLVLIVDDDQKLRKLLKEYLEGNGFGVMGLPDGSQVLETIREKSPDAVILDIMLPGKDGLEILKDIRRTFTLPVILLTAKGEDTDRIVGLELGGDDYLAKPFNPRELLARLKAVLRRVKSGTTAEAEAEKRILIKAGGLTLNTARQTVLLGKDEIELSTTEYRVLEVLMKNPNTVLSRDQLMTLARGRDFMAFDRSIDVHISKLRSKLETDSSSPKRIKTIWGSGYMFID
ncbi:MAG TPA: response regulator transcription factor [Thermodesulfobacteriota bacterium]|nr:response regulator transcription factor [Thermodesulfobacteriota bacterium]